MAQRAAMQCDCAETKSRMDTWKSTTRFVTPSGFGQLRSAELSWTKMAQGCLLPGPQLLSPVLDLRSCIRICPY